MKTPDLDISDFDDREFTDALKVDFGRATRLVHSGSTCDAYDSMIQRRRVFIKRLKPEFRDNPLYRSAFDKEYDLSLIGLIIRILVFRAIQLNPFQFKKKWCSWHHPRPLIFNDLAVFLPPPPTPSCHISYHTNSNSLNYCTLYVLWNTHIYPASIVIY